MQDETEMCKKFLTVQKMYNNILKYYYDFYSTAIKR